MSFLDNLENNLKSLESQEEGKEAAERAHRTRENQKASAQAAAPWAEELKKGPFTAELLKQAARIGFSMRLKVHVAWLGTTLRLEARDRRLELRPTANGVVAAYLESGAETRSEPLDLKSDAGEFVRRWLDSVIAALPARSSEDAGDAGGE
jgi:hypothetical protein